MSLVKRLRTIEELVRLLEIRVEELERTQGQEHLTRGVKDGSSGVADVKPENRV